jgi:hypothetical protein
MPITLDEIVEETREMPAEVVSDSKTNQARGFDSLDPKHQILLGGR